jgi:hypothetical protein
LMVNKILRFIPNPSTFQSQYDPFTSTVIMAAIES